MEVSEWQKRLEETFSVDGIVGNRLLPVIKMEHEYGPYVIGKFVGYRFITDSFFDFYLETLQVAHRQIVKNGRPGGADQFPITYLFYVMVFKNLRAVENLFLCGYPLDGYALLRDLKDRAMLLGAIINQISTFSALYLGLDELERKPGEISWEDYKEIRKRRKKEEKIMRDRMLGSASGLEETHMRELDRWEQCFHEEVHGSRWTFFTELGPWLKGEKGLSFGPEPNDMAIGMYMNRCNEIGWMFLRTLPYLQLTPRAFGDTWATKWRVLDDSFRVTSEGLGKMEKKIAWAFIALVDRKFDFSPEQTSYAIGLKRGSET